LGELVTLEGSIELKGRVAFVGQTSWIYPATLRDNVVFGRKFNSDWYDKVLHACGLIQDISTFPQRDQEILSDKGISLSGGQRARISLARSVI